MNTFIDSLTGFSLSAVSSPRCCRMLLGSSAPRQDVVARLRVSPAAGQRSAGRTGDLSFCPESVSAVPHINPKTALSSPTSLPFFVK